MKNLKFLIILFLLAVILFSLFKYASDEKLIENMNVHFINKFSDIVNNNPPSDDDQKIVDFKTVNKLSRDKTITEILNNQKITAAEKVEKVKNYIPQIKRTK